MGKDVKNDFDIKDTERRIKEMLEGKMKKYQRDYKNKIARAQSSTNPTTKQTLNAEADYLKQVGDHFERRLRDWIG